MRPIVCVYDGLWAICSEKWFAVPFLAELWAFKRNEKEKSLDNQGIFLLKNWRRGRDSNPRYAINVYTLSRRATSTTHPPLRFDMRCTILERVKGIEPSSKAWEAFVLPLNYTRCVVYSGWHYSDFA